MAREIGAERTGTSEPGRQAQPLQVHGEDGEDRCVKALTWQLLWFLTVVSGHILAVRAYAC